MSVWTRQDNLPGFFVDSFGRGIASVLKTHQVQVLVVVPLT